MQSNLEKARNTLEQGGFTCVVCSDDTLYTSQHRGVKPLLDFIDQGIDLNGFSAADKVIGKATALLYCLLNVKEVYAQVISDAAAQVFQAHAVPVQWEHRVDFIRNRTNTGRCPMETATETITDPQEALIAIRTTLAKLQG